VADLIVEVLCEELPVSYIQPALDGLAKGLEGLLTGIPHGEIRLFSTPRRLAVVIEDVAERRPSEEKLLTGPAMSIAKPDGAWSKAAHGFARGKGLTVEDLEVVDGGRGPVVAARVQTGGELSCDLVRAGLEGAILGVPFAKSMRWGASSFSWARPIHGVVAVLGGQRIEAVVAGIETTDAVVGHRASDLPPAVVSDAATYLSVLEDRWVMADRARRRLTIAEGLAHKASELGVEVGGDDALLDEVTDLVEWPLFVASHFEESLLDLPPRLLEESMRVHQRNFPTLLNGALTAHVLVVSNNPTGDEATIAAGNARVLGARFHDARFFYAEDRKRDFEALGESLERMRWVRGLGTMADKQARVSRLAERVAPLFEADPSAARRAGSLSKLDLVTGMVGEFPKLQGHMGRLYAEHSGESAEVARAIEEHYLPRYAGDDLPETPVGKAVALADRLDTLSGCFGIGLVPKGSADPQGLRRAANGVLALLLSQKQASSLSHLFTEALSGFEEGISRPVEEVVAHLGEFTQGRLKATLQAAGHRTDLADAVLSAGDDDPVQARARVEALGRLSAAGGFGDLMMTFKRVLNISKEHQDSEYEVALFEEAEESVLHEGVCAAEVSMNACLAELDIDGALAAMGELKPTVDAYFDKVLVMADEPELRSARLGLLCRTSRLFLTVADFRRISTE
jgi:glycyl-tRNA synthetase beta chain